MPSPRGRRVGDRHLEHVERRARVAVRGARPGRPGRRRPRRGTSEPRPRSASARARRSTDSSWAASSGLRTTTRQRESSAALTSNDGFSVVAPMRVTVPGLDVAEQRVLLGLVVAMDLVDEEDGAAALLGQAVFGPVQRLAQLLDPGEHGAQGLEVRARALADDVGERGLARPRRPPEDDRGQAVRLERAPQRPALAEHLFLADELVEGLRPDAIGERRVLARPAGGAIARGAAGGREQESRTVLAAARHRRKAYREQLAVSRTSPMPCCSLPRSPSRGSRARAPLRPRPDAGDAARTMAYDRFASGREALAARRWTDAESEFGAAVRLAPRLALAHYGLGQALMGQARYAEAGRRVPLLPQRVRPRPGRGCRPRAGHGDPRPARHAGRPRRASRPHRRPLPRDAAREAAGRPPEVVRAADARGSPPA